MSSIIWSALAAKAAMVASNACVHTWNRAKDFAERNPELVRKTKIVAGTALAVGVACYTYPEATLCAVGTAFAFKHVFPKKFDTLHSFINTVWYAPSFHRAIQATQTPQSPHITPRGHD